MPNMRRSTLWADVAGATRRTDLLGNATLAGVVAQIAAVSNGSIYNFWEGADNPTAPTPASAAYPSIRDAARLLFSDASGSIVTVTVPAPLSSIFFADTETVDPATIAALIAAATGVLLTPNGGAVANYVGGTRLKG